MTPDAPTSTITQGDHMTTELAVQEIDTQSHARPMQLVACSPEELAVAQKQLLDWCDQRIAAWDEQFKEAQTNYEYAKSHKWNGKPYQTQRYKAERKLLFYRKIREALEAGYVIVPNFPLDLFAIRTTREYAKSKQSTGWRSKFEQAPQLLPTGEGEYKNPIPAQ